MNSNINLNLYRTFYEVAKCKSISAAAKHMYMSQPAISKSLKNLENEFGVKLFTRKLNGCDLTLKGKELFEEVEEAFRILNRAEKRLIENKIIGNISIGVRSHVATFYLMDKVLEFRKQYKNVEISIVSRSTKELLNLLKNNEIDFIIDSISDKDYIDDYDVKSLGRFEHCFVSTIDYDTSNIVSISDLKNEPLILPVKASTHRKELENLIRSKNIDFKNVLAIETSELILNLVRKKVGIGYLLKEMVKNDLEEGTLKEVKIRERLPQVELKLIYNSKKLYDIPKKFIDFFEEKNLYV